jgi:hypothetical protein
MWIWYPGTGLLFHTYTNREKREWEEVLGLMIIEEGHVNVEIIEKELHHLFREVPRWNIKKMCG